MENFNTEIAEILEVDSIDLNQELKSFECWDSLTILSIIAFAAEEFNVTLSNDEIDSLVSVADLKDLISGKM